MVQTPVPAVISRMPMRVPAAMAIIISHSRATMALKSGPASNCQILVTKDGRMSRPAARTGGMKRPSTPMATVGSPMPVTPLTMPATMKVAKTMSMVVVSKSGTVHSRGHSHFGRDGVGRSLRIERVQLVSSAPPGRRSRQRDEGARATIGRELAPHPTLRATFSPVGRRKRRHTLDPICDGCKRVSSFMFRPQPNYASTLFIALPAT
ncbi:hypothetical protein AGR7C_Cc70088 [Agrobacterium deltaense Zutra 3/1]|uniref:Uncharacterized protein n=1 Tax=Agrobacterium deltaense Zutra 3/1 TaxID=1183427 RepID=A0A1S7QMF0_9HYPH|nr:hypothetical protein AGR7C_Cc70088 [Agrobacterium deltaense Zutra 3/1]